MIYPNAAAGLKTVYQSQIVGLIATVLLFIPLINILAAAALLVVFVLYMVGLNQCAKQDDGYRTAFTLVIINLVVNLLGNFIPGAISTILSLVGDVLTLATLYFVCITTNRLLENLRAPQSTIDRGVVVWKINVICTIVAVVCTLLSMIPGCFPAAFGFYHDAHCHHCAACGLHTVYAVPAGRLPHNGVRHSS